MWGRWSPAENVPSPDRRWGLRWGKGSIAGSGGPVAKRVDTRVAVVGYGYWGSKHVRVLSTMPDVGVVVVDEHVGRLEEAVAYYPSVAGTATALEDVLDGVDAVLVATPPAAHAEIALQAINAGKHVLVEKPMATSVADAEAMVLAAAVQGVQLMVGHTFEYNAAVRQLREIIRSGALGRVLYIDSARLSLGRYQRDVNVIWDLAPHDISIASYLLDELPVATSVWGDRNVTPWREDVAYLRLDFPQTRAFVHVSWLNPNKVRRTTVVGERKMAVYDDMSDNERIRIYDIGVSSRACERSRDGHADRPVPRPGRGAPRPPRRPRRGVERGARRIGVSRVWTGSREPRRPRRRECSEPIPWTARGRPRSIPRSRVCLRRRTEWPREQGILRWPRRRRVLLSGESQDDVRVDIADQLRGQLDEAVGWIEVCHGEGVRPRAVTTPDPAPGRADRRARAPHQRAALTGRATVRVRGPLPARALRRATAAGSHRSGPCLRSGRADLRRDHVCARRRYRRGRSWSCWPRPSRAVGWASC